MFSCFVIMKMSYATVAFQGTQLWRKKKWSKSGQSMSYYSCIAHLKCIHMYECMYVASTYSFQLICHPYQTLYLLLENGSSKKWVLYLIKKYFLFKENYYYCMACMHVIKGSIHLMFLYVLLWWISALLWPKIQHHFQFWMVEMLREDKNKSQWLLSNPRHLPLILT